MFVECQTTFQNQNSNGWKTHFLNNFGHHYEFQNEKNPKSFIRFPFLQMEIEFTITREIMKDEWRWFNLLWKTKFFWFFFLEHFVVNLKIHFCLNFVSFFNQQRSTQIGLQSKTTKTSLSISIELHFQSNVNSKDSTNNSDFF